MERIKRSLEKEKAGGDKPAQTQKLSSGTVLRRRSSGDKAEAASEAPPERAPTRTESVAQPPAETVVRRKKVVEETPAPVPVETKAPAQEAPRVHVRKAAPVEAQPVVEEKRPEPAKVPVEVKPVEVKAPEIRDVKPAGPVIRRSEPKIDVVRSIETPAPTPPKRIETPPPPARLIERTMDRSNDR